MEEEAEEMSKHLCHFIHTNFSDQMRNTLLSKKAQGVLRTLHGRIMRADASWQKNRDKIRETPVRMIAQSQSPQEQSSPSYLHIPEEIRQSLDKATKYEKVYRFSLNGDIYTVTMIYPVQEGDMPFAMMKTRNAKITRFCDAALHKIYMWLFVADKFATRDCSTSMNIRLYFTDHLKMLAKTPMEPLAEIHANTAFTTSCAPSTEIHLFRKEEWFKVFIHETFHNLGLDFSSMPEKDLATKQILTLFPIQAKDLRIFETYCETWAEIINVLFTAIFSTQDRKNWPLILRKIEKQLHYEAMWSAFQCAKILRHYGLTYAQLTDRTSSRAQVARNTQYREYTYILSYYVIKAVFMSRPSEFLEWCLAHNDGNLLNFKKTGENIDAFCTAIATLYQDPVFLNRVLAAEEWFRRYGSSSWKNANIESHTLRMTLFG